MKIVFILPGSSGYPSGGPKVVFEYANGLLEFGHSVEIIMSPLTTKHPSMLTVAKSIIRFPQRFIDKSYRPDSWFKLDDRIKVRWTPSLDQKYIPDADIVVATAWKTAEWVSEYNSSKGKKIYLIQHKETWDTDEARLIQTWKLPLTKIVISQWLADFASSLKEKSIYIPNGLDFKSFNLDTPIEKRDVNKIMMLYHTHIWKGSKDGLQALYLARNQCKDLKVNLYGISNPPPNLPDWIHYTKNPSQKFLRKLYNESSIFVSPSWAEGWPLPPAEAMMCGATVVATDIGGHKEYLEHMKTGVISPVKDHKTLATNILQLTSNIELRIKLANNGNKNIQQFTWDKAINNMNRVLTDL